MIDLKFAIRPGRGEDGRFAQLAVFSCIACGENTALNECDQQCRVVGSPRLAEHMKAYRENFILCEKCRKKGRRAGGRHCDEAGIDRMSDEGFHIYDLAKLASLAFLCAKKARRVARSYRGGNPKPSPHTAW